MQNGKYETAYGKDGTWRASEISTEHYTIQADKTSSVYGRYFKTQVHMCVHVYMYIYKDTGCRLGLDNNLGLASCYCIWLVIDLRDI